MALPIDWTKPHLRIVYLVEGQFRDLDKRKHLVRWCGPKSRTGSGLSAPSTTAVGGFQRPFEPGLQQYEARLSRCVFDKTLGTLKQNIQALSQITFTVDLGDEDRSDRGMGWEPESLRDMALYGRWRGQPVRFTVADLDDFRRFEVLSSGTWDKDPTDVRAHTFKMTIDVGTVLPPTLRWPMWQVPEEVPPQWEITALLSTWASGPGSLNIGDNRRAPLEYKLNEDMKGKFVGQVFGGGPVNLEVWRELAHYGVDRIPTHLSLYEYHYCLISGELDQFCFDVAFEADNGEIYLATGESDPFIFVWNNVNPRWGPIGTVCKFAVQNSHTMDGAVRRIWGKIGGGPGFLSHGPNYTGYVSFQGYDGTQLGQTTSSADAAPDVYGPNIYGAPDIIFKWIIEDLFGGDLHPDAIGALLHFGANALPPVNVWNRACAIPTDIDNKNISVRAVLEGLLRTIPADLMMKRDDSDPLFRRKYFAVPRPQIGDLPIAAFTESDLVETTPPQAGVKHLSDPDGSYANEITVTTDKYYVEPDRTDDVMEVSDRRVLELVDIAEQSDGVTGQVIAGEIAFKFWNWATQTGFRAIASVLEKARARPQPVLEATHGYPSFRYELGDLIRYEINGVYHGPGQIRGMRLDLDKQTVTMRTYHMPDLPKAFSDDGSITRKIKAELAAKGEAPTKDRIPWEG